MSLNDAALVVGSNAIAANITHVQFHSTNVGGTWATGAVGSRQAVTPTVDADGDITITVNATGLPANTAIGGVSYWTAATGGANRGGAGITGDATTNSAGEYSVTISENNSST